MVGAVGYKNIETVIQGCQPRTYFLLSVKTYVSKILVVSPKSAGSW